MPSWGVSLTPAYQCVTFTHPAGHGPVSHVAGYPVAGPLEPSRFVGKGVLVYKTETASVFFKQSLIGRLMQCMSPVPCVMSRDNSFSANIFFGGQT